MRTATLAFVLLLSACNTADSMTPTTTPDSNWKVEITSTGGFTGRGAGSVTIDGDGSVSGSSLSGSCNGSLSESERGELQRAVDGAKPNEWRDVPPPTRGADMIRYTLSLTRGGETRSISWTGEDAAQLPADAAALFDAAWKVRGRVC